MKNKKEQSLVIIPLHGIMNCWICNAELIWGGDHDIDEEEDCEYLIVTNLSCPDCESSVLVYHTKK